MTRTAAVAATVAVGVGWILLSGQAKPQHESRAFRMGFTPFPYDATLEAVAGVRGYLATDADIVAAHFEGVPWTEAASGEPFRRNLADSFAMTRAAVPPGAQVYLAVSPLDMMRKGMAAYRGDTEGLPIPEPFAGKALDDPVVVQAYLAYCRRAIEYFSPSYVCVGIEVNELFRNSPEQWPSYVRLHEQVYRALKADRPELPIFVSLTLHDLMGPQKTEEQRAATLAAIRQIMPYSDLVAISFYPFIGMLESRVKECLDWLDREFGALGKPFAVAEMGESAEPIRWEPMGITIPASPEGQRDVLRAMLDFARTHEFRFLIWFVCRDYDALWTKMKDQAPDIFILWRDCGLLDGEGASRPAHELWRQEFALPLAEGR